jgi:alkane 1-monooxygenase
MNKRSLKYGSVYITPLVVLLSLASQNHFSYFALIFLFGFIPLVELFTKGSRKNLSALEEELVKKDRTYDILLYGLVPVQYSLLLVFLYFVSNPELSYSIKIGMSTAMGMACGVLGINAAHELGHRTTSWEQNLSKMLLLTSLYLHFFIEHNRGHHKNVSTDQDPASSRPGESLYAFLPRTLWGSYLSAWNLEKERLLKRKKSVFNWENQMIRFQVYQIIFVFAIYGIWGYNTLLYFLLSAFIGILLLETVNYIEHYGLRRKKLGNNYERTLPIHSWNSNHPVGRLLLLELSRHSDHHYNATRKYPLLRHFDNSPQMPTGYPGMMLLAFIPPLWFKVMHNTMAQFENQEGASQSLNPLP